MVRKKSNYDSKKEIILALARKGLSITDIIDLTPVEAANQIDETMIDFVKEYTNKNVNRIAETKLFLPSARGKDKKMSPQSLRMTMKTYIKEKGYSEEDRALFTGRTPHEPVKPFINEDANIDRIKELLSGL